MWLLTGSCQHLEPYCSGECPSCGFLYEEMEFEGCWLCVGSEMMESVTYLPLTSYVVSEILLYCD